MTAMLPANLIVGTHNRPHFCFGNCSLECREIDFVQCTVTEVHIDMPAPFFLIVQRKMLDTCRHAILLNPLNVRHHHCGSQVWIFTHILKISAVKRRTVNIHARSKQYIFAAITRLFTYCNAIGFG